MPFIESAESVRAKAHISEVKTPALLLCLVLMGFALFNFAKMVYDGASASSFMLGNSSDQSLESFQDNLSDGSALNSTQELNVSSSDNLEEDLQAQEQSSEIPTKAQEVWVFVSGAVENPGVYTLKAGERIGDAIEQAGGFSEGAALDYNNLARPLADGEQIHVPLLDDLNSSSNIPEASQNIGTSSNMQNVQADTLININTAQLADLEKLPGIGPSTAEKIIAFRQEYGPFETTSDLLLISGIGEKKFAALEGLICV